MFEKPRNTGLWNSLQKARDLIKSASYIIPDFHDAKLYVRNS